MPDLNIEIARNAATNGRLFNVMVCAVMIALAVTKSDIYFVGALLSALSVGVAYVAETFRVRILGHASIALAISPLAILAIKGF